MQPLSKLPCRVLLELHPGVPELDVREETVRLQVPADGGLEIGQLVRVGEEQALKLVRPRLPLHLHGAGRGTRSLGGAHPVGAGDPEEVAPSPAGAGGRGRGGARPTGARGLREVGGGTAVFSNGPEPRVPKDCLTVGVGDGSAAAVFFNGPEVRVPRDCLRIVTHPSV